MTVVDDLFDVRGPGGPGHRGSVRPRLRVRLDPGRRRRDRGDRRLGRRRRSRRRSTSLADAAPRAAGAPGRRPPARSGAGRRIVAAGRSTSATPPPCAPWSTTSSTPTARSTSSSPTRAWPAAARRCCPEGSLDDMSMTDYDALIDINLHGVVYTVQAAARHMKRQRSGSIVTTASTAGPAQRPVHAVLVRDRQGGRRQLHQAGRARPGPLERAGERDRARPVQDAPRRQGARPRPRPTTCGSAVVPLGRMGDPAEIRGLALLLARRAGSFMTGGVYPIDGGALLQGPPRRRLTPGMRRVGAASRPRAGSLRPRTPCSPMNAAHRPA